MAIERTLVMIKPDGVARALVGEVIHRLERRGLKLVGLKMLWLTHEKAEEQYAPHKGKPFFESLIQFVTQGPVVAIVCEGENAVGLVRNLMGALEPTEALPGSIRGDFALTKAKNVMHGADTLENAEREIALFFSPEEIFSYERCDEAWTKDT